MFLCCSLRSSHPRLLPLTPKVFLSCIWGYCYHLSESHIYVLVYCIGVYLSWITSLCIMGSSFILWEGGSGWGTHVNPWLIHVNVWQKPLQYCKVISLQIIKINEKKINYTVNIGKSFFFFFFFFFGLRHFKAF